MSTPGVPQWGCPWHGLVKDFRLPLSNGTEIFFPQPGGNGTWEQGSTALIQHPAAPEIERTPEETVADVAAGRQWWNKAIIAGDSLHGRELGGWIYIDPAGACWLVRIGLYSEHIAGGTTELTLSRFGVLGGKPEEHTYTVVIPDMGQSEPTLEGVDESPRITRYHTNKTGSAAVFEVAVHIALDVRGYWAWRPCGWLELVLAGPGSECVAELSVLKNRAQTLGAAQETPMVLTPDFWYFEGTTEGSRLVRTPSGETTANLLISHYSGTANASSGYDAYVVGMYYDDTGRHEITLSEQVTSHFSAPVAAHSGETEFGFNEPVVGTWTATNSLQSTLTITYSIDGAAVCSYSYSYQYTNEATAVVEGWYVTGTETNTRQYTPGVSVPGSGSYTKQWVLQGPDDVGANTAGQFAAASSPELIPNRMGGQGNSYEWVNSRGKWSLLIVPHRHSNTLFGMCSWFLNTSVEDEPETFYLADLATPVGKVTMSEFQGGYTPQSPFCYGSWCPVTGQAVRALQPVCWV